jgi:indoleamine 2,3-dioxygenase
MTGHRSPPRIPPFPLADAGDDEVPAFSLPANHFLSRSAPSLVSRDGQVEQRGDRRPDTSTLASADYDVDVRSGFLPPEEPLRRLPKEFDDWENSLVAAREALAAGTLQRWALDISTMDVLPTVGLYSMPLLRRAHLVLSFLAHFYIHSSHPAKSTVPAPIAVPWAQVSERLDMPPILTYSTTVLWNWGLKRPELGYRDE